MAQLAETSLGSNGSCLHFCERPGLQQCLVVGTYELHEEDQTRTGELVLYSYDYVLRKLTKVSSISTAGVFDLSSNGASEGALLAAALSNGYLQLLSVEYDDAQSQLRALSAVPCFKDAMVACVDFDRARQSLHECIAVSSSAGTLGMINQVSLATSTGGTLLCPWTGRSPDHTDKYVLCAGEALLV